MLKIECISVGALSVNCYIVSNENRAVVIDPGDDFLTISEYIDKNNLVPEAVLLTHGHFDHIGACNAICQKYNIHCIINEADLNLLTDANLNLSLRFLGQPITYTGEVKTVTNQSVNLIGCEFGFISTPGHTPGSMCIKVEDYLFTGDTLFRLSVGNAFAPYGDFNKEIVSIKTKLLTLDFDYTCFTGHGDSTTLFYEKKYNQYLI